MRPSPLGLLLATLLFVAADWGAERAGNTVVPGGPVDELAHLITTLLVLWALGRRYSRGFFAAALAASVLIDIDHLPGRLGWNGLTAGTSRPYTHSLLTIIVVLGLALLWRRHRSVFCGVAAGLALHFWRDLSEGGAGAALLWPLTHHSFTLPRWSYLAVVAACIAVVAARLCIARLTTASAPV